ncbi:MAG TPA: hypothetical protein VNW89_02865, partial [Stellaceae bacterium]|nr:hypothetical protein [Stellaceae bacterium]
MLRLSTEVNARFLKPKGFVIASAAKQSRRQRADLAKDCHVALWAPRNDGVDGPLTASMCQSWVFDNANGREPAMKEVTTIGLDLAKKVFQV